MEELSDVQRRPESQLKFITDAWQQSLHAVLLGIVDCKIWFDRPERMMQPISFIQIYCNNPFRLMHFRSPLVRSSEEYR
ncbi:hypothetical protein GBA52_003817 [Prunus armeniaca]|nr:hypothetical protein GBA52_003817 [Prunus armeniaca]